MKVPMFRFDHTAAAMCVEYSGLILAIFGSCLSFSIFITPKNAEVLSAS